ncbi:unnamed protein product [Somion occarium]|uniref:sterol 3beta-glucosyltransferase n=2 Tax=Somion occarium TaxID=3059160 RepID=A0ABP1CKX3_9APHY
MSGDQPVNAIRNGVEPFAYPSSSSSESSLQVGASGFNVARVKRVMEKTADTLNRSRSLLSQSQPSLPIMPSAHRRFLTRGKGKERASNDDDLSTAQSQTLSGITTTSVLRRTSGRVPASHSNDDSPFITPKSPPFGPTRSMFNIFRGDGSMRAGTQTLIQALQAMPWSEDQDNDDDIVNHGALPSEPESDDEDKPANWLTSSIHTIYRPVARSRRRDKAGDTKGRKQRMPSVIDTDEELPIEGPILSDEEAEGDFEPDREGSPDRSALNRHRGVTPLPSLPELDAPEPSLARSHPARSGSMATVKVERRARLAEKLRDIFDLKDLQQVISEMPCWLLRSVLLQGYMYLTDSYLCFFAHLPSREDQVLKSGALSKRAQRTKRWIKHWFVLKNDVLSWYQSSSDPYFPHGVVDLRYALTCEPTGERDIRLRTNQKTIRLSADSVPSRDEWVKAIRKVMFKAQNMGDSVKIAIPYSAIVDVERSSAMDFSETIEIKVMDRGESYSVDSYFFAYFHDLSAALEQIRDAVRASRDIPASSVTPPVIDTTVSRSPSALQSAIDRTPVVTSPESMPKSPSYTARLPSLTSFLRPFQESFPPSRTLSAPEHTQNQSEEFTYVSKRSSSSFIPITTSPEQSFVVNQDPLPRLAVASHASSASVTPTASTYLSSHSRETSASSWSVGVPSWLKIPSRRTFGNPFSSLSSRPTLEHSASMPGSGSSGKVSEVLSSSSFPLSSSSSGDYGFFSILEAPEAAVEPEIVEKFHSSFALDEKETLLGYFSGYIFRLLPIYGRLYISTNHFCFRSSGPLTSRTRMILPIRDVLSTEPSKAFRFGHHGLVVIVRGHEELFFEFADEERRTAFVALLERQMEAARLRSASGETHPSSNGQREALILEEFGPSTHRLTDSAIQDEPDDLTESVPAVMFTSQSSTFLTFKPKEPLHFTFLTIGSRGDVQPYIALAKGLMADGHSCRIATHGEFKEWIESHGIEFGYVGGDPAELMRICVENGMFTVSFLKETMQKFRGWLDDLLKTSWEACQGTDVIVESPSAMGGFHIAEALRVPYFRAFTMTWSRTRAYPHAFAVPEHKMGGNYNYMSYVVFDQVFWRATAGQINRWRRNLLGLPSTSLDKMEPHKVPFLYNFSPVVVPPPLDWPEWIRITGYWFLNDANVGASKWAPSPGLVEFIDSAHQAGKKVVYIGFGSIVVSDPKGMTRTVVDAIIQSGVYAILSKGWSDRLVKTSVEEPESSEPLPKQIYPITSIPHDWLFNRIDAACHHGGAGTTGASLRAGIPTIIKPFFGDQFFWADRVEALGIGTGVRKLTVTTLSEALVAATTDQKQIHRAKVVGESIRAENGVATAIEAIYRDLEYARSLIKGIVAKDESRSDRFDDERDTIREQGLSASTSRSRRLSGESSRGATSDWSVISDQEDSPVTP